ncbi:unnamed protein product [Dicrocoelium dendriticum]|nr:unnamed protein product [Dicrocoelium dendriticum]
MVRYPCAALQRCWRKLASSKEQNNSNMFATSFPWRQRQLQFQHRASNAAASATVPSERIQSTKFSADDFQIWYEEDSEQLSPIDNLTYMPTNNHSHGECPATIVTNAEESTETVGPRVADLIEVYERIPQPKVENIKQPTRPGLKDSSQSVDQSLPNSKFKLPPKEDLIADGLGDLVLKLRDAESKFERRQRYQSMFKDAPLYQVYTERSIQRDHAARKPFVRVSSGNGACGTNSLEFVDTIFTHIDDDETDATTDILPTCVTTALEAWKRQELERLSTQSEHIEKSRGKSPPPVVTDSRSRTSNSRSYSSLPTSPLRGKSPVRSLSDAAEMQAFVASVAGTGPNRAMWCKMPQVVSAGLVDGLTKIQRKLQEALFEILTSEASYFRSLNVLIEVFYKSPYMQAGKPGAVVSPVEKHHLFSNVLEIHMTSENFLRAMEACFREDPWLMQLCEIVYDHTETKFDCYITYVQNQMYQTRALCKLRGNPVFLEAMRQVQSQPDCAFLDLNSFLLLPMQRVTRLRLLTSTVLRYAPKNTTVYRGGLVALAALERFISECDAKKSYMEQKERLIQLTQLFEYNSTTKTVATESRRLIKEGELRLVTVSRHSGSAFQRKLSGILRQKVVNASLFLFSDLLVIAKKRSNDRLMIDESCALSDVTIKVDETPEGATIIRHYRPASESSVDASYGSQRISALHDENNTSSPMDTSKNGGFFLFPFRLCIRDGTNPPSEYRLQAKSLSERERWIDAISPAEYGASQELLIRDCPQVLATKSYSALEGDELELKEGDCASLLISLSDGWCKGMLPDGSKGWFPSSVCVQVEDATMKRENMKNFLIIEEARNAYARRKAREQFSQFPRVKNTHFAHFS